MDIKEKQARWAVERPLFEAEFIHSHLLPFFKFNENTGDYEIKSECVNNTDDEDRKVAYETLNTGWVMWLRAKRTSKAVPEVKLSHTVTLTCAQLLEAFRFGAPDEDDPEQLKTEMTITWSDVGHSGKGYYCYYSELPEEGAIFLDEEGEAQEST
jgi:hypothetical protein